ncbi:MAG: DCC1-like thiol-disulfide oxidoreductase family protein [Prolixibacteraceae bacterium]|jgi:predicted DCC family thiol-disulfide oxidoreductase YuxK
MKPIIPEDKLLIQFDGICVLCSRTIRIILKADKKKKFLFQTLQDVSKVNGFDTVIVVDKHSTYEYFDAVLKIGSELGGIYKAVAIFRLMPRKWRHAIYLFVARNRFHWFGTRKTCYLPSPEEKERFI